MRLWERLPDSVQVGRRRYRVDLDFRNVLALAAECSRGDLLPEARSFRALRCVMRRPPRDTEAALAAVRAICFPRAADPGAPRRTDLDQDADLIRAAFRQVYGIDLRRSRLHWLEFTALLSALPDGTRYADVLAIRARPMPPPTRYNAAERAWLRRMKALCALRLPDGERKSLYERGVNGAFTALAALAGED